MAYYYDHHHRGQDLTRDWAHRVSQDARHNSQPSQYIVNEGRMRIDERTLRHSNAIIYNAPGSSLRISPSMTVSSAKTKHSTYYAQPSTWWTSGTSAHTCHGCYKWRELYYGDYCHECSSIRQVAAAKDRHRLRDRDDRYLTYTPERRLLGWY
ncbi:hypothetical protein F4677DRAFT_29918 [Hypoxylon crocopeplum]|nr:hypothetical protein F4677DRAFT_29918 [Hypoxylon crocopeplum]